MGFSSHIKTPKLVFVSVSYISKLKCHHCLKQSPKQVDTFSDNATKDAPGYQRHLHEERKYDTGLTGDLQSFRVAARDPAQNIRVLCVS